MDDLIPEVNDGTVSTLELAREFGVTTMTICNWVKRGMPVEVLARVGQGGHRLDPVKCRAWIQSNRTVDLAVGSGGTRAGAGRKRGRPPWRGGKTPPATAGEMPLLGETERERGSEGARDQGEERTAQGPLSAGQQLNLAKAENERLKAEKTQIELATLRGELLERTAVSSAFTAAMLVFAQRLEDAATKIAAEAVSVLGIDDPEAVVKISDVARNHLASAREDMVERLKSIAVE